MSSDNTPAVGAIKFGDLRRLTPIGADYGFERGRPIDRFYIEDKFLSPNCSCIKGAVLEVAESTYTRRFGEGRVTQSDVLHAPPGNANANIVEDITNAETISSNYYDCVIFTQTLLLVFDYQAAIKTLFRILRPGGVLLATFPGISRQLSHDATDPWPDYWRFTSLSARRLFIQTFGEGATQVETYGNVFVAAAFLFGLACEDLKMSELEYQDPAYEMLITVKATKATDVHESER